MLDSIRQFFQNMYDSTIGTFTEWYSDFIQFVSGVYDILLIIILIALAIIIFKLLKYVTVPAIILGQIAFLTITITGMIAFVTLIATSLVSIYNRMFDLADYLSNMGGTACVSHMLDCLSVNGILSTYFTELFSIFIVVLLIRVSTLYLWAFDFITERVWRLGVLMGLM